MKKIFTLAILFAGLTANAADSNVITLDLAKATTPLTFNAETGAWTGTYDDDETAIESQCFSFVKGSMGEYKTWWGFTASNSTDNARKDDTLTFQFSNMAKGGIVLNEDGTVKTDDFGAPVTSAEMPYLVGYYGSYFAKRPVDMTFNTGKSYDAVGVYVNLNSYPYYCIEYGDAFARAFNNGDKFTLTIHGVAPDETEKEVTVELASYTNGNLTINRGWSYVDITSLGTINELYFTIKSTDSGDYGDNTPAYFCMDKLMVKENTNSGVEAVKANGAALSYDRDTNTVSVNGADFAMVYDLAGNALTSSSEPQFSISHLPAGVYVVKAGNSVLKIAR